VDNILEQLYTKYIYSVLSHTAMVLFSMNKHKTKSLRNEIWPLKKLSCSCPNG